MEEVVKKIIEIEDQAQRLVNEGREIGEKIYVKTQSELKEMEENIMEMARNKVQQLRMGQTREKEDKIYKIHENTALKLQSIEQKFKDNQELWEEQIFDHITGR